MGPLGMEPPAPVPPAPLKPFAPVVWIGEVEGPARACEGDVDICDCDCGCIAW
jgi:hypothetical protein